MCVVGVVWRGWDVACVCVGVACGAGGVGRGVGVGVVYGGWRVARGVGWRGGVVHGDPHGVMKFPQPFWLKTHGKPRAARSAR